MEQSVVYFTKEISPEGVLRLYKKLGVTLKGKVAIKVHSGEEGNQNFLHPEFWKPVVNEVKGTIVECNTAYEGARNYTNKHKELMKQHGWSPMFDVDIMDEDKPDLILDIPDGLVIKKDYVGSHLANYDSLLVLSHFKGHPMGGFGGALKQLSIGCASSEGKAYIHSAGKVTDQKILWTHTAKQDDFLTSMADAASVVHKMFKNKVVYINVMKNMSVDCDCVSDAEDPCLKDIGILISTDPIAIDQACLDLVYSSNDPGKPHFIERVETRHGHYTIEQALKHNFGTTNYKLISID